MALRARPADTGSARSTYTQVLLDGVPEIPEIPTYVGTCLRYSLLADSLPRWYLPEESGQGGDAVGEGGGQGGWEGGYAGASQPARHASIASSAQCPVPLPEPHPAPMRSALSCFCAQGLFNTVSLPPCPSALPVDSYHLQNLSPRSNQSQPLSLHLTHVRFLQTPLGSPRRLLSFALSFCFPFAICVIRFL